MYVAARKEIWKSDISSRGLVVQVMFQFRVHVLFQYLAFSHSQDSRNLIKKVTSHLFCRKVVLAVVQWTWKLGRGQNVIFCQIFKRCLGQLHVQVITELWCHLFLRLVYFKLMLHDLCCWLLIYHLSVHDFFNQTFPHTEVNVLHLYVAWFTFLVMLFTA